MKPGELVRAPILVAVGVFLTFTVSMMAQVQSTTTTTTGTPTQEVTVERGEVVYVGQHDLIIKMENGEIRHITNIPDSARATVGGKEIGIRDAKVGMKLQKTVTTTTTPRMVTKVETVTGKVFHVVPPLSVILTLENGENQQFKIPEGQKFDVDGQMVDAFGLRKGMKVTVTRVTEVPETVVTQKAFVSGKMPPPLAPAAGAPVLIVAEEATPAPAAEAAPTPAEAPAAAPTPPPAAETAPPAEAAPNKSKTAIYLLMIALLGALILFVGLRRRASRRTR
jgi:hypothetical protein